MEEDDKQHKRAELAARAAGAAIQHGYGQVGSETEVDPAALHRHDSVVMEVAKAAISKGFVKGEDIASVSFAAIHAIALDAASSAIQKGVAKDETEPEITEEQKKKIQGLSILAASAAVQHHFGEEVVDSQSLRKISTLANEVADAAILRKLVPDERHDPTLKDLAEVARRAAGAAIQKHLAVEDRETRDEVHEHERQKIAALAAGVALQHGHGTERPSDNSLRQLSSISKSAADAAVNKTLRRPADIDETQFKTATEVTQFAIEHQLIDHPEPPSELVAEVARMAAAAAIQRGLTDEELTETNVAERKEVLASVARKAASFAIQRGLGAEVVPNRRRGYELAVLAASAALRRQEQERDANNRINPAQIAEVARQAAHEAVRLGYGVDEGELMVMPKTPPVADNITKTGTVNSEKTDHLNKEVTGTQPHEHTTVLYSEAEIEHFSRPRFCFCLPRFNKPRNPAT